MESDTHTVKTTWPVEPSSGTGSDEGFIRNDTNGTIYVGEGCWGAPTRAADDGKNWTRNMGQFNQFKLVFVSETEIEIRTINIDNAPSVGENSDTDPFTLPANLNVWNPSEGAVVTILPAAIPNRPNIEFISETPTDYSIGANLVFEVDVLNEGAGITKIDFYIDGNLTNTDTSIPYSFTDNYADGNYKIEAIATASNGETSTAAKKNINVGNFTGNEFVAIIDGNDDIEENGVNQSVYSNSSDLELVYDGAREYQKIGLRFQNINIPKGATITNAYIQFMADGTWTNTDAEYNIFIENTDNSETFENNSSANLTGRSYVETAINWAPPSWTGGDITTDQQTPELKFLLQNIIDLNTWKQDNTASFKIEAAGASLTNPNAKRRAESFEGNYATRLYYSYSYNAVSPKIEFDTNLQTSYINGSNISLDIDVLDNGNSITKVDFYIDGSLYSTDTSAPYNLTKTYTDESYQIEAIATDTSGKTGNTRIYINIGSFTTSTSTSINNGNDDVEETEAGRVYFTSSDLEMVYDTYSAYGTNNGYQKVGLRFQDVNIPAGATITSAYIQFRSDEVNTDAATLLIYAEDSTNAMPFEDNSGANISARNLVDGVVNWNPVAWNTAGTVGIDQRTSEIKSLLQKIVNRCNWEQGNSSVFIIEGTGISRNSTTAKRVGDSFEGSANNAAKLVYTYAYDASLIGPTNTQFISGAWTEGTPSSVSSVKISSDYDTSIMGDFEACSCKIENGKTLTITANNYININRDILVNGNLIIENEGSVVQKDGNGVVINNGYILVEKITPILSDRDFTILGSPMTGETKEGVYGSALLVRYHDTNLFTPNPDVENDFPLANNFADDNGDNWQSHTGSLIAGEGYLVKPFAIGETGGAYTTNYTQGTLNNGVINFTALFGDNQNDSPNILSNPYPSAIRVDDFINTNSNAGGTVYFWEHLTTPSNYPGYSSNNYNMGDISSRNATGGLAAANGEGIPSNFIPSGQGFGIKASSAGTITFNNNMRSTVSNTGYRNNNYEIDKLYLNVSNNVYGLKSQTLIGFTELASNEYDQNYDSKRLATPISIYSINNENEYGIQGCSEFNIDHIIPLGFSTQVEEEQEYTISINELEGDLISNSIIYLKDNLLHTFTNLSETDYSFTSNAGNQKDRFVILFGEEQLGNSSFNETPISLYPNPAQNIINIDSPLSIIKNIEIYDLNGRKINSLININKNNIQLDFSSYHTAIYFIKINTEAGSIIKRALKN